MSITPICDACARELDIPGALVFSPPGAPAGGRHVAKYHLCTSCFEDHFIVFDPQRWTVEHSMECRLSGHMSECAVHTGIVAWIEDRGVAYDAFRGRWLIRGFDTSGTPALDRAAASGGTA